MKEMLVFLWLRDGSVVFLRGSGCWGALHCNVYSPAN